MTAVDPPILLYCSLFLCVCLTVRSIRQRKQLERSQKLAEEAEIRLVAAEQEKQQLQALTHRLQDFQNNLNQAELSTKIERSRQTASSSDDSVRMPEKYRYIHSLAQKGIDSSDIASILAISHHEADQLLALANLSKQD